jgi:hypothetical protein
MFKKIFRSICLMTVLVITLASLLEAQVVKVRDFQFAPRQHRNYLARIFAHYPWNYPMGHAVTTKSDVLSFVGNDTGAWELYKVSDWLGETPVVKKLVLPGYFSKQDEKDIKEFSAHILATRDGAYAVCVGSVEWLKQEHGRASGSPRYDDIISVVDVSKLTVVASLRTRDLGLFDYREVTLDDEGYIRILGPASGKSRYIFTRLSIPSLAAGPICSYESITDSPGKGHPQPLTVDGCKEALKTRPLDDYLDATKRLANTDYGVQILDPDPCGDSDAEFCHSSRWRKLTADQKFGLALDEEGHDNIFGGWSPTSDTLIVFSMAKRADIGQIKEPVNDFSTTLTSLDGRDYLLVIQQDGSHFLVYELKD